MSVVLGESGASVKDASVIKGYKIARLGRPPQVKRRVLINDLHQLAIS